MKTIEKFPLSITPYYLSLIDVNDYKNDPIFRQAFPSPSELVVENYELADPLAEDKDSPCGCITHRYPAPGSLSRKQHVRHVLLVLHQEAQSW